MSAVTEAIREFVRELHNRKGNEAPISDQASLISSGLLDSIDVLEIVAFLESKYAIDFSTRAFDPGDFDTIEKIAKFIE